MANYYGVSRSNEFYVKDPEKFRNWIKRLDSVDMQERKTDEGKVTFKLFSTCESGSWPGEWPGEEEDEWITGDFVYHVAEQLEDDEVVIFMEAGHEKLRYVGGWAIAINNKMQDRTLRLEDIHVLARELTRKPENVTDCSW